MKPMKRMMEGMMPVMIKGISPEERETLMLEMMPMMMKEVDLTELMPKMMASVLPAMLPQLLDQMHQEGAGERMLDTMAQVMPNVCETIDKEVLAQKKDAMLSKLMQREAFREKMPRCFIKGVPVMVRGCFEHFFPSLTKEERRAFISRMMRMMLEAGTGDFSDEEKQALLREGGALPSQ
ncbi:MAG: hypothetical protein GF330_12030 [Candidatus Eisenbacteria bacterium]|nr:hypothetical protein [Candidatus Eisenbacteria bacterium]